MLRKLFDAPFPESQSTLPNPLHDTAAEQIRGYWRSRGWQLVLGEIVLYAAAVYRGEPYPQVYLVLAVLMGLAYLMGVFAPQITWLVGVLLLFGIQALFINGLGAVTALSYMVPYTIAGMILTDRHRFVTQMLCVFAFWTSLIYEALPLVPQIDGTRYIVVSYNILLAAFTFQTLRFLNQLAVEINSAYVAEQVRMQSQQFLARVSHDLRTPLNSMLGFSKLLSRADLTPRHQTYLKQVIDEGEHLNRLVSDLLDSAHLSTGKLTLVKESCNVNLICKTVVEERRLVVSDNVLLTTDLTPDCPTFPADPIRLRQAIGNLTSNAIKHTTAGQITVRTRTNNQSVFVDVIDTGKGISDEQQQLIFVPFVQLDVRQSGVGLGLDIALQLVRLHGGDIHLHSVLGQGSTFTIELPIHSNPQ